MKTLDLKDELRTKNSSKKIRKGDTVIVIAGNCKGQQGKILAVDLDMVLVEGINMCKRHVKPSQQRPKGGIDTFEKPIHVSNVKLLVNGEPVKLKSRVNANGERVYVAKSKNSETVYRSVKNNAS